MGALWILASTKNLRPDGMCLGERRRYRLRAVLSGDIANPQPLAQPYVHRAKVNPKPWESRLRDEIGYCYPVGEGESPSPTCLKLSQPGSSET